MRQSHGLRLAVLGASFTLLSCKLPIGEAAKTDPANGTGSVNNWSFTMSLAHNNFTIAQNATDTNIVTFTRVGGFTGPINLDIQNMDSGVVITREPVTATGAITTTRLMTHVNGPHPPFPNALYNVHAVPVSTEVEGQFADVKFAIVRKDGTFTNAPTALSVGKGQAIVQRISVIRTNFSSPVPMNIVGAPAGVTATFSPNPISDTVTQMTLSVDLSVAEGVYNIGVRANEGTNFQGTAPVALTVTSAGTISLTAGLSTLAVPRNTTVPGGVTITRNNYAGPVTITLSGVPAGVTTALTNPVTGNNFSINFTNTATGTPGSYPILVTASGPGLTPVSITITINVS